MSVGVDRLGANAVGTWPGRWDELVGTSSAERNDLDLAID
jgi:hypothetical protein